MSVVIVGGNECMVRRYTDLCREYNCKAKVYPKMTNGMKEVGSPDSYDTFHRNRIAQDGKVRAERDRRGNKNSTEPYKLGLGSPQYS